MEKEYICEKSGLHIVENLKLMPLHTLLNTHAGQLILRGTTSLDEFIGSEDVKEDILVNDDLTYAIIERKEFSEFFSYKIVFDMINATLKTYMTVQEYEAGGLYHTEDILIDEIYLKDQDYRYYHLRNYYITDATPENGASKAFPLFVPTEASARHFADHAGSTEGEIKMLYESTHIIKQLRKQVEERTLDESFVDMYARELDKELRNNGYDYRFTK